MVTFIVIYIFYFSWFGYTIFQGTLQGTTFMPNMGDTLFNMIVLMTTSNYPDVMLPAYQANRWMCFFFITYLFVGLFLILNLLLAIIFNIFKENYEQDLQNAEETRTEYLERRFLHLADG